MTEGQRYYTYIRENYIERQPIEMANVSHLPHLIMNNEVTPEDRAVAHEILENCHQPKADKDNVDLYTYIDHEEMSMIIADYRLKIQRQRI